MRRRTARNIYMSTRPSKELETFPNPREGRDYTIRMELPEVTCLCPKTGQPDFAEFQLEYVPDALCVELKALKLYMWSFRDEGHLHEDVTNRILDDLVAATQPKFMRLVGRFNVRGGIWTTVIAEHRKPGWQAPERRAEERRVGKECGSASAGSECADG